MLERVLLACPVLLSLTGAGGQHIGATEISKGDTVLKGLCDRTNWEWFIGKELRLLVDSSSLDTSIVEIERQDDGGRTLCFFHSRFGEEAARTVLVIMDNWVDLSYLFVERNEPLRILRAIKRETVRDVICSDHAGMEEVEDR